MKARYCIFVMGALVVTVWAFGVSFGQTASSDFSVDSYIPDYFSDFEWRIFGRAGFDGHKRDANTTIPGYFPYQDINMVTADDNQRYSAGMNLSYRYRTIPDYIYCGLYTEGSLDWLDSHSSSTQYDDSDQLDFGVEDREEEQRFIRVSPWIRAGKYIFSDYFLSITGTLRSDFLNKPDGQVVRHSRLFDSIYINGNSGWWISQINSESQVDSDQKSHDVDGTIAFGWGRIYEGQYAATALYMIHVLDKEGVLLKSPTFEEMNQLTEIIYRYRLKHAVDRRIHRIEALTAMLDHLEDKGIIGATGPYGYLLIQDLWDYYPRYFRSFGTQTRIGGGYSYSYGSSSFSSSGTQQRMTVLDIPGDAFPPDTNYNNSEPYSFSYQRTIERMPYLTWNIAYYRPSGLRWQFNISGQAWYYINPELEMTYEDNRTYPMSQHDRFEVRYEQDARYRLRGSWQVTYILNTRTLGSLFAAYEWQHYNAIRFSTTYVDDTLASNTDSPERYDIEIGTLQLTGQLEYRITIPTRLVIGASYFRSDFEHVTGVTDDGIDMRYDFSVSINHYLF